MCVLRHASPYTATLTRAALQGDVTTVITDSGAGHSCVNAAWFHQLPAHTRPPIIPAPEFSAVNASGSKMVCPGKASISVQFPNVKWCGKHTFYIIENLPYHGLLGTDFLAPKQATVCWKKGLLTLRPGPTKLIETPIWWFPEGSTATTTPQTLIALSNLHIPPNTSQYMQCFTVTNEPTQWTNRMGLIEPLNGLNEAYTDVAPLHIPHTMAQLHTVAPHLVKKRQNVIGCAVAITNFSDKTVFLRRGTELATFTAIQFGDTVTLLASPPEKSSHTEFPPKSPEPPKGAPAPTFEPVDDLPQPHPSRLGRIKQTIATLSPNGPLPRGVTDPSTFDLPGVPTAQRGPTEDRIRTLLNSWSDVFSSHDHDFGLCTTETLTIELTTDTPQYQRPYNIPHHLRPELKRQLDLLYQHGVTEDSCSPFSAPIVLVAKKDGSIRVCLDFRRLNAVTKKDGYPLPRIDTALGTLRGARVFSTMDLNGGYHQVPVAEKDREKLAFTTPWGQYQFKRAPFGVTNMPAVFSRMMNKVFAGMLWIHVLIYLDDILCLSETVEDHITHLTEIFSRLKQAGLKLKGKKCQFFMNEVQYLGHRVSSEGIMVDPSKVEAIKLKSPPTTITELRSDLGLFSYYRAFVHNFSSIAEPLNRLLGSTPQDKLLKRKLAAGLPTESTSETQKPKPKPKQHNAKWEWGPEQAEAYDTLRQALMSTPILAHPDLTKPFIVDTDASQRALGAVCSQISDDGKERPVAYASRTLSASERNYSATKREALGVFWAIHRAFHMYTYGAPFILRTDHSSLLKIFTTGPPPEPIIAGWQLALSSYVYDIQHRAGKDHSNADGLSRPSQHNLVPGPEDPNLTFPEFIGCVLTISKTTEQADDAPNPLFPILVTTRTQHHTLAALHPFTTICTLTDTQLPNSTEAPEAHRKQPLPISSVQLQALTLANDTRLPTNTELVAAQQADPILSNICTYLNRTPGWETSSTETRLEASRCFIQNDILFVWVLEQRSARAHRKEARIYVPPLLRNQILHLSHDAPTAGHMDNQRTFHRISTSFWWPGMWQDVLTYTQSCKACQLMKTPKMQNRTLIHEGFQPTYPFQYVAMDITELMSPLHGRMMHLLIFIDLFTRWVEVKILDHAPTSETIVSALIDIVIIRHGTPEYLVSDNGPNIVGQVITEVCRLLQTKRIFTSPYTPQTNGTIERFNRTLKTMLATLVADHQADWMQFLPQVLQAYRTSYHASIQDSPFFLLYGRDPRCPSGITVDLVHGYTPSNYRTSLMERIEYATAMVQATLKKTAAQARSTFNKGAKKPQLLEGLVLKLIPPEQRDKTLPPKLRPHWAGPFRIIRRVTPVTYDIQQVGSQDVSRAHYRTLKPYFYRNETNEPAIIHHTEDNTEYEVAKVIQQRWNPTSHTAEFLIKWKGLTKKYDSWVPLKALATTANEALADFLNNPTQSNEPTPNPPPEQPTTPVVALLPTPTTPNLVHPPMGLLPTPKRPAPKPTFSQHRKRFRSI